MLLELLIKWIYLKKNLQDYKCTKYANDRNKVIKMAVVRTNRLKSRRFTAILQFSKGISTIQGIRFTFKTHNDRTNENKVRIFVFTVHETLIMSTYLYFPTLLFVNIWFDKNCLRLLQF